MSNVYIAVSEGSDNDLGDPGLFCRSGGDFEHPSTGRPITIHPVQLDASS